MDMHLLVSQMRRMSNITLRIRNVGNFLGPHTKNFCGAAAAAHATSASTSLLRQVCVSTSVCVCVCVCLTCLLMQYSSDCKRSSYSPAAPLSPHLHFVCSSSASHSSTSPASASASSSSSSACALQLLQLSHEWAARLSRVHSCSMWMCAGVLFPLALFLLPLSRTVFLQQSVLLVLSRFALKCIIFAAFLVATLTTTSTTTTATTATTTTTLIAHCLPLPRPPPPAQALPRLAWPAATSKLRNQLVMTMHSVATPRTPRLASSSSCLSLRVCRCYCVC